MKETCPNGQKSRGKAIDRKRPAGAPGTGVITRGPDDHGQENEQETEGLTDKLGG